jgi:hypothetical protein
VVQHVATDASHVQSVCERAGEDRAHRSCARTPPAAAEPRAACESAQHPRPVVRLTRCTIVPTEVPLGDVFRIERVGQQVGVVPDAKTQPGAVREPRTPQKQPWNAAVLSQIHGR